MQKTLDCCLEFRWFWEGDGCCRLRIYEDKQRPTVVILTELPENSGEPLRDCYEDLATAVYKLLERPAKDILWIEHSPADPIGCPEDSWNFVRMRRIGTCFLHAERLPLTCLDVEALIGQPILMAAR